MVTKNKKLPHSYEIISPSAVEKRYGISYAQEREKRAYMSGLTHKAHPLANAAGKGLKTVLRVTDCKPIESVPRVFV